MEIIQRICHVKVMGSVELIVLEEMKT